MDKLQLKGRNLGRVFNLGLGRACVCFAMVYITKQPNLKLKTRLKQLLGSLLLAFELPAGYPSTSVSALPPIPIAKHQYTLKLEGSIGQNIQNFMEEFDDWLGLFIPKLNLIFFFLACITAIAGFACPPGLNVTNILQL
jgi:hypothetical protein